MLVWCGKRKLGSRNVIIRTVTSENLKRVIGLEAKRNVREMGGVMSRIVSQAAPMVTKGLLTPEEGLEVFKWAIEKEEEIEGATDQGVWKKIVRDSLHGKLLRDRGDKWFKLFVNGLVDKDQTAPYEVES